MLAGVLLASVAYAVFLRTHRDEVPALDRQLAPVLALGIIGILGLVFACFWVVYQATAG